jgi:endonuclease G
LNIDDFDIQDISTGPSKDDNMGMGNPSSAVSNVLYPNNYLMVKPQYALSYNSSKGEANWVSWHLSSAWKGSAARCDCFATDNTLPSSFYKASTTSYSSTGFDRGHICPSEDRDFSSTDNAATFLMTNMIPQSPNLNRITWVAFENYCRTLLGAGNELYIISGGYGSGGTGSNGGITSTIASGAIQVPARCWKIAVVLPIGTNDVSRVSSTTRVIAVDMPNNQTVNSLPWSAYRVSVDAIEASTGYDFLNAVPTNVQSVIEASADNLPVP